MDRMLASLLATHAHEGHHAGWLIFPLLWLAAIGTIVWLVGRQRWRGGPPNGERAKDILAERFARGEIASDEYRERLEALR